MSTAHDRHNKPATDLSEARPGRKSRRGKASFAYGYREVCKKLPDGRSRWVRLPLTLDDVLHPRLGDVHLLSDPHTDDCTYLRTVLKAQSADDPSVVVLSDCGIYWDIPGLRHHSPDLAVIFGVKKRKDWTTFRVKTEKVRPSLIVEVTSDDTRVVDVKTKVDQYAMAKVPHYVIVDAHEVGERRRITLIAYRLKGKAYQSVPPDKLGRVSLEPVNLLLGVRKDPNTGGDRVVLIKPVTNEEIGDYTEVSQSRAAEAQRADAEARRADAEARRADADAKALADAEARVRAMEEELRRLRGRKTR
jgi:colicin import membrane protein